MGMYGALYRNVLFPTYESFLRRRRTLKYLRELEASQWLPPDEIRRRQWRRLKEMLEYAVREVPFYKEAFERAGVSVSDIREEADLDRIPPLTKEHLRTRQDDLIAIGYRDVPLIDQHSSGSTGMPVGFKYDRDHYDHRIAAWTRADRWSGWDLGERYFLFMNAVGRGIGTRPRGEVLKEKLHWKFMNWMVMTCTRLSPDDMRYYHKKMCSFKPRVFFGYAVSVYTYACFLEKEGLEPPPLRSVIVSGEQIFPHQKEKIEKVFHAPVFERYGCQEFCNIAMECDRHEGMHINADGLLVEILDENGKRVPDGEVGEIVITSLDNFAMPFIRYRVGDMGVLDPGPCGCGRGLPLLRRSSPGICGSPCTYCIYSFHQCCMERSAA